MRTSVDLHNFLLSRDVPHEISVIEVPAKTVDMAAALLGLDESEIGKILVVVVDGEPVIVMVPGNRRLYMQKLKEVTGASRIKLARPDDVLKLTGYIRGSIPPLGHANEMPVYIDHRLLAVPTLHTSGGQTNSVLRIKPIDLIAAGNAQVVDVADDGRV